MKTLIITAIMFFGMFNTNVFTSSKTAQIEKSLKAEKLDIKIKPFFEDKTLEYIKELVFQIPLIMKVKKVI